MVEAAIFDLNGTLIDDMPFHGRAWAALFRELGVEVSPRRFERELAGMKHDETFAAVLGRELPAEEAARLGDRKDALYREIYAPSLRLVPGARDLVQRLRAAHIRTAIATAAPVANRDFAVDGLGIRALFDAIVGAEAVAHGKPAPDLYLAAARAVSVHPARCIAFEDAVNGIRAARAAGMHAAAVTTTTPAEALRDAGAEFLMQDFAHLPSQLEALIFS
ncbi:MAG TPA: HAD-IA family hydrolase [Myxococcales bacterium]|nr:HAD-IA family hydrolase [Myxococcales bacterium]